MSIFDDIRGIPFFDIAQAYGMEVTRQKTCKCPFHQDGHPSMKIYGDHGYCFACNTYADGAKLVGQLYHLTPIESARKIAGDFGITEHRASAQEINKFQQAKSQAEKRLRWANQIFDMSIQLKYLLLSWDETCRPLTMYDEPSDKFAFALQNKDYVDWMIDQYFEEHMDTVAWAEKFSKLLCNIATQALRHKEGSEILCVIGL